MSNTTLKFDPKKPLPANIATAIKNSAKLFNNADRANDNLTSSVSNIARLMFNEGITADQLGSDGGNGSKAKPYTLLKSTARDAVIATFHPKAQYLITLDRKTAEKVLTGKAKDPTSKSGLTKTRADRDRQNSNLSSRLGKICTSLRGYEAGGDGTNQGANAASKGKKTVISAKSATCTVQAKTLDEKIFIAFITLQKLVQNKESAKWSIADVKDHLDKIHDIMKNKK